MLGCRTVRLPGAVASRCVPRRQPRLHQGLGLGCRGFGISWRNRGTVYVPRKVARQSLERASRRTADRELLLPPFVSASELRVIFRLDYDGILKLLGVRQEMSKYFWKDGQGREFETASKRNILVPYHLAAIPAQGLGLKPRMVDVEPDWDVDADGHAVHPWTLQRPVPVVAVLGHINHGKTTLLDALCGTEVASGEPGGITQDVRALTAHFVEEETDPDPMAPSQEGFDMEGRPSLMSVRDRGSANEADEDLESPRPKLDRERITFLDTPGHEAFEVHRGRTMASADLAIVVVSVERGAEVQTEEVLMHASNWKVPVVFALNKIDLPDAHVDLTRAELRRQCQRLLEAGLVDVDWTREAEQAIPISALHGLHLETLVQRVQARLEELPALPLKPAMPPTATPGEARRRKRVKCRTDFLVGIESAPTAVALVVEMERGADRGERVLTLIVRAGRLFVGQFFVVGTAMGRISQLAVADGSLERRWVKRESASVGVAVQIMGLRVKLGGDCAPDDLLFVVPRERAWRLSEHRRRLEQLTSFQTAGEPLEVPWENDSMTSRTQAAFDRSAHEHPEKHADSAYERRWAQPAVEQLRPDAIASPASRSLFSEASRKDFMQPLERTGRLHEDDDEAEVSEQVVTSEPVAQSGGGGRRHARRAAAVREATVEEGAGAARSSQRGRFQVLSPADGEDHAAQAEATTVEQRGSGGRGRKSARTEGAATGAWASAQGVETPKTDTVYYTDRQTWTEEADINSSRLRSRWQWRDVARWEEEERQQQLKLDEKKMAEEIRKKVFGIADDGEEETAVEEDKAKADFEEEREAVRPLPPKGAQVVSMILKTKTVSQFDVLLDEVERVQENYGLRVVVVHGGLGPVIPKDVVHAEIEKGYGFCPIYAFQVGVNPVAGSQAEKERIDIRRFDVFSELVADVALRCEKIYGKASQSRGAAPARRRPHL